MMAEENHWRGLGWAALIAALAAYGWLQGAGAYRALHGNDFRHLYLGSVFLRHGMNPYDELEFLNWRERYFGPLGINPYVYPPTTGLALRFLTHWDWITAQRVWFVLNHVMLLAALALCAHLFFGFRNPWLLALIAALAATSFPLRRTFTAGQLNCVLLLLYSVLCWAVVRKRAWLAGLMVGFGTLFKLVPGIFFLYFLWTRRWRCLLWSGVCFAVVLTVSVAAVGWKVHAAYWPVMRAMGYGKSVWEARLIHDGIEPFYRDPYNQSLNSFFHHILAPDPVAHENPRDRVIPWVMLGAHGKIFADILTWLVSLFLLALALWAIRPQRLPLSIPSPPSTASIASSFPAEPLEITLMILLSLLLPSILWDHYAVALFLPQIALFAALLRAGRGLSFAMAVWMAASIVLAMPIAFDQYAFLRGPGLLGMSAKLFGVLALYGLAVARLRAERRAPALISAEPKTAPLPENASPPRA
ncbi:MAG: DUF2029 domain-containing protein [Candidatus Sumerlaeia bacterium]|nr:DUF2029 domain-containing protein [Candidatus Sumerlaeia bacterium]